MLYVSCWQFNCQSAETAPDFHQPNDWRKRWDMRLGFPPNCDEFFVYVPLLLSCSKSAFEKKSRGLVADLLDLSRHVETDLSGLRHVRDFIWSPTCLPVLRRFEWVSTRITVSFAGTIYIATDCSTLLFFSSAMDRARADGGSEGERRRSIDGNTERRCLQLCHHPAWDFLPSRVVPLFQRRWLYPAQE